MSTSILHQYHLQPSYGLFIGQPLDQKTHRHYALQLTVGPSNMKLIIQDKTRTNNVFFIPSGIEHQLISTSPELTILINPLSTLGHYFSLQYKKENFSTLIDQHTNTLSTIYYAYTSQNMLFDELCKKVNSLLLDLKSQCERQIHLKDTRIVNSLEYLEQHNLQFVNIEEIAKNAQLSTHRYLHLFKEKTGLTFRRYQLWDKLLNSLPYLFQHSIASTAHEYGFTNSSHYTRTFKESFGVTPFFFTQEK